MTHRFWGNLGTIWKKRHILFSASGSFKEFFFVIYKWSTFTEGNIRAKVGHGNISKECYIGLGTLKSNISFENFGSIFWRLNPYFFFFNGPINSCLRSSGIFGGSMIWKVIVLSIVLKTKSQSQLKNDQFNWRGSTHLWKIWAKSSNNGQEYRKKYLYIEKIKINEKL